MKTFSTSVVGKGDLISGVWSFLSAGAESMSAEVIVF
jgi:hypothetical protein